MKLRLGALLCGACQLLPTVARGEPLSRDELSGPDRSLWRESWPTVSWVEGATTVAAGAGVLVLALEGPPEEARWQGGILFDDALRDGLRAESAAGRRRATRIGDLGYRAAPAIPLLIDPLVAWAVHRDAKTAANIGFIGVEAFAYAGLLSFVSTRISARERPESSECRRQHPDGNGCGDVDTESFWSGHTSIAAASAGVVCANHSYIPLWGHPVADASACVLASGAALTTGIARIAADRHYGTDVLLGLSIGFTVGYGVPVLLHYSRSKTGVDVAVGPCLSGNCLSLSGAL